MPELVELVELVELNSSIAHLSQYLSTIIYYSVDLAEVIKLRNVPMHGKLVGIIVVNN